MRAEYIRPETAFVAIESECDAIICASPVGVIFNNPGIEGRETEED